MVYGQSWKKGLHRQNDGTKIISFNSHYQHEWPKCSHEMAQGCRLDKINNPSKCCLQETHFEPKDTSRLKVRQWRATYHANGPQKKAGVAILISDKLDSKLETVVRDVEGHYIILKGSIQQEDLTILNIYAPTEEHPTT